MRTGYKPGELDGDWATFAKIAGQFANKVPLQEREDLLHDIILEMAKVKRKYQAKGKPLRGASLNLIAEHKLLWHFAKRRYRLFGLNCTHCTPEQRRECRMKAYGECPKGKAHQVLSLNKIISYRDGSGHTERVELILVSRGFNLDARLDARSELKKLPRWVVKLGYRRYAGYNIGGGNRDRLKEFGLKGKGNGDGKRAVVERGYLKQWKRDYRRRHLDERILQLLRKNPQGLSMREISMHLNIGGLVQQLAVLIIRQEIFEVERQNTRGRALGPLFLIAGAPVPQEKMLKTERDNSIREAFFTEEKSIKQIAREFHHDKRIVRRAIHSGDERR